MLILQRTKLTSHPTVFSDLCDNEPALQSIGSLQTVIPTDLVNLRSWLLATQAGSFTWPHQDSSGVFTTVTIADGGKLWGWVEFSKPRDIIVERYIVQCLANVDLISMQFLKRPVNKTGGDLTLQPERLRSVMDASVVKERKAMAGGRWDVYEIEMNDLI